MPPLVLMPQRRIKGRGAPGRNPAPKNQPAPARGRLNHITAEEAQEAPDVVLGTFSVNSVPANVLFDSGASHSFVTEPFALKSGLKPINMSRDMLVQIPGSVTRVTQNCVKVPLEIHGVDFNANLII
jgi:Retroviral aspartyl protease.